MRGCPTCSQLYAGDQIRFCRWDGATLQPVIVTLDDETTRDLARKHQKNSAQLGGAPGLLSKKKGGKTVI